MTDFEAEIDLRPLAATLLKGWWRILALAVAGAALLIALGIRLPRQYSSSATLLLTRSRSVLELADQFPTINENIDSRSRLDALLSIASSDAIANQVIRDVGDQLPEDYRTRSDLRSAVEISSKGDTILIKASMETPEDAMAVASAWARHAVRAINQAYSGVQPLEQIDSQLSTAQQSYQQAQKELENFLETSPVALLENQISQAQELLNLMAGKPTRQIQLYESRRQGALSISLQARALLAQIESGSRSQAGAFGDALAVTLARANLLGLTTSDQQPATPYLLQVNLQPEVELDSELAASDLRALAALAETEAAALDREIQAQYAQLYGPQSLPEIEAAASHLSELKTRLEAALSRQKELQSARDLSWQTYQALVEKSAELRNTAQVNDYVSLAADAVLPDQPDQRGLLVMAALGALAGVVLGSLWSLYPLLRKQLQQLAAWS